MTELKKCPFCGKEMTEDNFFTCDGYPQACGCWEKTNTAKEAEKVWNTRPLESSLQAEVDNQRQLIKELVEDAKDWFECACQYAPASILMSQTVEAKKHQLLLSKLKEAGYE